jgi:peptide/nickel transport system permease protein
MNSDTPLLFDAALRHGRKWITRDRTTVLALVLLLLIALPCIFAPFASPYDPTAQPDIIGLQSRPPSSAHPLGTDDASRDVLSRLLYGGRLSLSVAVFATLVSVTLGTAYGAAAGYATGIGGAFLQRILDALLSIPRLLLLIAIFAAWRDISIGAFIVILGFTGWYGLARLVRGQVLALKAQDFVASARALGATPGRILFRHVLPNVLTPVIVAATLGIGHVIVLEAGLSYLGIGVRPPTPSWGNMIQDGSDQIAAHWWISLFPGLAIVLTVLAFNVLGDALLRALQPRQQVIG